jgi:uncharacterized protein (TIGR00369 family)
VSVPVEGPPTDHRRVVGDYFRLERWEIPSPQGTDQPAEIGGRTPVDQHQRGPGGGLRTGALLTSIDSLGGFICGLSVLPRWIVTTSMMATVSELSHRGPLRLHGRVLRRGRNAVVCAVGAVDEGAGDRTVASAVLTCAVLDPGDMDLQFARPFSQPMGPPTPDPVPPEEFFRIRAGGGTVTTLELADHLRNPWGILHGGAVAMLTDVAASRAVTADRAADRGPVAAADTVLHYLRPVKVGPVEARCRIVGSSAGRTLVRVGIHDLGADGRLTNFASVTVVEV